MLVAYIISHLQRGVSLLQRGSTVTGIRVTVVTTVTTLGQGVWTRGGHNTRAASPVPISESRRGVPLYLVDSGDGGDGDATLTYVTLVQVPPPHHQSGGQHPRLKGQLK